MFPLIVSLWIRSVQNKIMTANSANYQKICGLSSFCQNDGWIFSSHLLLSVCRLVVADGRVSRERRPVEVGIQEKGFLPKIEENTSGMSWNIPIGVGRWNFFLLIHTVSTGIDVWHAWTIHSLLTTETSATFFMTVHIRNANMNHTCFQKNYECIIRTMCLSPFNYTQQ